MDLSLSCVLYCIPPEFSPLRGNFKKNIGKLNSLQFAFFRKKCLSKKKSRPTDPIFKFCQNRVRADSVLINFSFFY